MATSPLILVVDDEEHILDVVLYALEDHGFRTVSARDAASALAAAGREPDLVLLDLNLAGASGLDVFRELRALRPALPVIMVTARGEEIDRVLGLELGADDYVTKPFSPRELVARVKSVLRRAPRGADGAHARRWRHGAFVIDVDAFRLEYRGQPVDLTRGEFRFLETLLRHPARVFTRESLMDLIYDDGHIVADRSIDAYVRRLRRKFESIRPGLDPIETVHGIGYKLRHTPDDAP